mmetsp:Transcript_94052/g.184423  ORF Transcript_94052/g.184423 Transcript_94052/m.184423 type:complete len:93 (-) Transcript_94052:713-991(-)
MVPIRTRTLALKHPDIDRILVILNRRVRTFFAARDLCVPGDNDRMVLALCLDPQGQRRHIDEQQVCTFRQPYPGQNRALNSCAISDRFIRVN